MGTRQKEVLVAVLRPFASHGWMKQIQLTIHPFSALIGAALVCLTMLTVGAIAVQGSSSTRDVSAIEIVSDPHPRDFVRVVEDAPFTVPIGRILVVTGMGMEGSVDSTWLTCMLNGSPVLITYSNTDKAGAFHHPISRGLTAMAGDAVFVDSSHPSVKGILLGYLVDA